MSEIKVFYAGDFSVDAHLETLSAFFDKDLTAAQCVGSDSFRVAADYDQSPFNEFQDEQLLNVFVLGDADADSQKVDVEPDLIDEFRESDAATLIVHLSPIPKCINAVRLIEEASRGDGQTIVLDFCVDHRTTTGPFWPEKRKQGTHLVMPLKTEPRSELASKFSNQSYFNYLGLDAQTLGAKNDVRSFESSIQRSNEEDRDAKYSTAIDSECLELESYRSAIVLANADWFFSPEKQRTRFARPQRSPRARAARKDSDSGNGPEPTDDSFRSCFKPLLEEIAFLAAKSVDGFEIIVKIDAQFSGREVHPDILTTIKTLSADHPGLIKMCEGPARRTLPDILSAVRLDVLYDYVRLKNNIHSESEEPTDQSSNGEATVARTLQVSSELMRLQLDLEQLKKSDPETLINRYIDLAASFQSRVEQRMESLINNPDLADRITSYVIGNLDERSPSWMDRRFCPVSIYFRLARAQVNSAEVDYRDENAWNLREVQRIAQTEEKAPRCWEKSDFKGASAPDNFWDKHTRVELTKKHEKNEKNKGCIVAESELLAISEKVVRGLGVAQERLFRIYWRRFVLTDTEASLKKLLSPQSAQGSDRTKGNLPTLVWSVSPGSKALVPITDHSSFLWPEPFVVQDKWNKKEILKRFKFLNKLGTLFIGSALTIFAILGFREGTDFRSIFGDTHPISYVLVFVFLAAAGVFITTFFVLPTIVEKQQVKRDQIHRKVSSIVKSAMGAQYKLWLSDFRKFIDSYKKDYMRAVEAYVAPDHDFREREIESKIELLKDELKRQIEEEKRIQKDTERSTKDDKASVESARKEFDKSAKTLVKALQAVVY